MSDAGRAPVLPDDGEPTVPEVDALACAYLEAADGNPSLALRLALTDRMAEEERLSARLAQLQALVSRGFARWGQRHG
jgi:hypothetical protein